MRGCGGKQVTASLLTMPRLNGKALISVLPTALTAYAENELFKSYIAECSRLQTENIAKYFGGNYIDKKYSDLINPKKEKTADEIVKQVISDMGLEVI